MFYILGAAHYAHCIREARIGTGESFTFVAIEKDPPYGIMIYPADSGCLDVGERWRKDLTRKIADAKASGVWPGYDERAYPLTPPDYASVPLNEEFYE